MRLSRNVKKETKIYAEQLQRLFDLLNSETPLRNNTQNYNLDLRTDDLT